MFSLLVWVNLFFFQKFHWIIWLGLECLSFLFHFFPLFVIFGSVGAWSCWSDSLQSELIFHIFKCVFQSPPSFFSPLIWFCSCSSVVLAGSNIMLMSLNFLNYSCWGLTEIVKEYHFLILLLSWLIIVLSSPVRGWGFGSKSVLKSEQQFSFSFFFC